MVVGGGESDVGGCSGPLWGAQGRVGEVRGRGRREGVESVFR